MRKSFVALLVALVAVLIGGGPLLATLHSLLFDHQSPPCPGAEHLLVLSHGFLGTPTTMKYLENEMNRNGFCKKKIRVYKPIKNFGSTTDGVDKGGKRLADEVAQVLSEQPSLRDVSFIGLSLGGVYCRAAAAELWAQGLTKSETNSTGIALHVFVSLASPHAGTGDALTAFEAFFASRVIGWQTAHELMLGDDTLVRLADSEAHQKAWAAFRKRILYANVVNDNRVGFTGAALYPQPFSQRDPGETEVIGQWHKTSIEHPDDHLSEKEKHIIAQLRQVPIDNVDVRFDGWAAKFFAHTFMGGHLRLYFNAPGQEVVDSIIQRVLQTFE